MARVADVLEAADAAAFPDERFQTLAPRDALGAGAPLVTVHTCQFAACPVGREVPYTGHEPLLLARASEGVWKVGHKQCWLQHVRQLDEDRVRRLNIGPRPPAMTVPEARTAEALLRNVTINDVLRTLMTHAKDRVDVPPGGWPITDASPLGFRAVLHGTSEHAIASCKLPVDGFVNVVAYATSHDGVPPWPPLASVRTHRSSPPLLKSKLGSTLPADVQVVDVYCGMGVHRRVVRMGALSPRSRQSLQALADRLLVQPALREWHRKAWSEWPELGTWHQALVDAAVYWCGSNRVPVVVTSTSEVLIDTGGNQIALVINLVAPRESPRLALVDNATLVLIKDAVQGRMPLCVSGAQLEAAVRAGECSISHEWPRGAISSVFH